MLSSSYVAVTNAFAKGFHRNLNIQILIIILPDSCHQIKKFDNQVISFKKARKFFLGFQTFPDIFPDK